MYYDDGDDYPIAPKDFHVCNVEISDETGNSDDLSAGAKTIQYDEIQKKRSPIIYSQPSSFKKSTSVRYNEQNAYICQSLISSPTNGAVIANPDPFYILLQSRAQINDADAWQLFARKGIVLNDEKFERHKHSDEEFMRCLQHFQLQLQNDQNRGHMQFLCASDTLHYAGEKYRHGDLLNLYLCKTVKEVSEVYPPVLSVWPRCRQTFAPLAAGQILQLVLPITAKTEQPHKEVVLHLQHVQCALDGQHQTFYYYCWETPFDMVPIFFRMKSDKPKSSVVIVPALEMKHGEYRPVLFCPADEFTLHCNNYGCFVIRTTEPFDLRLSYLDKTRLLKVESYSKIWVGAREYFDFVIKVECKKRSQLHITNLYNTHECEAIQSLQDH